MAKCNNLRGWALKGNPEFTARWRSKALIDEHREVFLPKACERTLFRKKF